ncbi:MAG: ATP-binding protein [Candidatus Omnitrophica bacterium]|nr:ATP-binding protein [Candidatus Omnitrophota bacterium]MBU0881807.1 ATP-binding protein [Candidatus Omnitrophota bacterium]MBU0895598.1 ATP-binding protein [Candidatus Omnitrophota bacterium]MBU1038413.1 ATP-binding protein [Candidatus Omnitrophota bacterium]MBU1808772.1 ATP-binding protein [Candidatus Omnitrophota bacterium]
MTRSGPLEFLKRHKEPSGKTLIKVPSETRYINKVSSEILSGLARYGVDESRLFDIRLCVEEAVRNAMVHGNHCDKKLPVRTVYWVDNGVLNVEIADEGPGFDSTDVADPTLEPHMLKNSGRGVYLIKKLMDKIEYNEKGNKITMTKILK